MTRDLKIATAGQCAGHGPEGTSSNPPEQPAVVQLTERQAIVLTAFTGRSLCPFHLLQEAVEEKLGHITYTHQYGQSYLWDEIHEAFRDELEAMLPAGFKP